MSYLMKMKIALCTIMAAALITGCTNQDAQKTEETSETGQKVLKVAWWGNDGRKERTLKVIELFEKKYPDIKVEPSDGPNGEYWTTLAMNAADQEFPDVIQMDYKYIDEFVQRKLLLPLDELVSSGDLNIADLDASSLASGKIDDKLYGVVTGINAQGIIYNPDFFTENGIEPPSLGYTYEDLAEISRQLKAAVDQPGFYPIGSGELDFPYYLRQRGTSLYSIDGSTLGYDKDEYLADFFKMEKQFIDEKLMASPEETRNRTADKDKLIVNKLAAFHMLTSNNVVSYSKSTEKALKLIPLPGYKGGSEGNYVKPSMYFSVSAYTKQTKEAALFVDFFFNDLDANDILQAERGVPATAKVREHLLSSMKEEDKEQYKYMEHVEQHSSPIDPPVPLVANSINILFTKARNQMLQGDITPEEAAKQFRDGATEVFAEVVSNGEGSS
ncbi:carbohydrate ABC transporter substrate-binding protein [Paenibacillus sp. SZ31]|uniref:extracellular solute-binding protein n=1 Tax=Paenibacillus sp. SZ31 TaxID=2725555 RepID=UPI00146ED282|nr:carbohydrate ABC transporter substrate-binding protein [Paenibacillus sp. SZ31]